ncbi:UDP-N-acetylmuramoyl-L-alanyl-D-glutamate--2,6-diaminopimelate ligase [Halobacillus naozhouensis]|uniref:UDP-N-acetylmuramyl-tripeptide synthetase n=1 Tax=Halobacillus naozhouensis TaxID=554880 RepID=A0ABY8J290_9BACI|nr:UDP-N-acetylmuramoyl-L-alanyl-D-glutamate--2,6-diaminopimelate ligase [Halobacillus naozhouensis]WFT75086.1 UDP-N-acetylmuramoyl-L-alanyl-D-glutamate--2,6-diaminopimelate ligase [Halobacillus naozhouensis]
MMTIRFDQIKGVVVKEIYGPNEQMVSSLAFHSGRVSVSSLFFSIKGAQEDGHHYIEEAISNGASAVIGENSEQLTRLSESYPSCTFIVVEDVRNAMAHMSKHFYNHADEQIFTVGITGTNGKTTVAAYVRSLLMLLGVPSGSIGTTGIWSSQEKWMYKKSTPTTPEAIDLHQIFRDFKEAGDEAAVMEVSSIALDQKRVEGMLFDIGIHTNFSEEHLEYHKTIDHYKASKMKLFEQSRQAVVNIDDEGMGKDLIHSYKGPLLTYSLIPGSEADLIGTGIEITEEGSMFTIQYRNKTFRVFTPVFGAFNVANVLSAIAVALMRGYTMDEVAAVLPELQGPEGRFQIIEVPDRTKVILDYAHTPVALDRLVEEVRKMKHGRLITMIAGIGIRDFSKMPKMAATIEGRADEVIVTVDHPGYHNPQTIVDQVMKGFKEPNAGNIHHALTRQEGVRRSLMLGQAGDIILLTGGCMNNAQIIKGEEVPHSDEDIIHEHYLQSK